MVSGEETFVLLAHAVDLVLIALIVAGVGRAYRMTRDRALGRFAVGFVLLGLSHVAAAWLEYAAYSTPTIPGDTFDRFDALFWAYYGASLAGFGLVFASFGRHPFRWAPALSPILLVAAPVLESLVILALFFVVLHAGLNHISRARAGSLQTALGFFALLVGHFLFFLDYAPLTPRAPIGELPTTLGYLLLLLSIARPRGRA